MRCKKFLGMVLTFVMIIGLLPVVSERNMQKVRADDYDDPSWQKCVSIDMDGITSVGNGWTQWEVVRDGTLLLGRDEDAYNNKTDALKLTDYSRWYSWQTKWSPVSRLSTSAEVSSTINKEVDLANVYPGDSVGLTLAGSLYGELFDQTSVIFYRKKQVWEDGYEALDVEAHGKIGDGTLGEKTINIPAGMSAGEYKMMVLLEKFGASKYGDKAIVVKEYPVTIKGTNGLKSVTFDFNTPPIKKLSGGGLQQTDLSGAMEPVVFTVSDQSKYYFPENYESIGKKDGITVTRDGLYQITVSGTPATDSVTVKLANPATKVIPNPPAVTSDIEQIKDTTTDMEYADSAGASSWKECTDGSTAVSGGTWYVRYAGTDEKQPSKATEVNVPSASDAHAVLINLTDEAEKTMSHDPDSGSLWQRNFLGEMTPVVLKAKLGYYFPSNYPAETKKGVTLEVVNDSQIKISGTPEDGTVVFEPVPASVKKSTPQAPTGVKGDVLKITGTTEAMEYADAENPDEWKPCSAGETPVSTPGVKYVRYKESDKSNVSEATPVTVKEEEQTVKTGITVTIINPMGSNITIAAETENLYYQTGIRGAMRNVTYYADGEYYFPSSYRISPVNGVRVTRSGAKMLTVSGTPTEDTVIQLQPAVSINTPLYDAKVVNGTGTEKYVAGTSVEIAANDISGQTFTGWKVNKGDIKLVNAKSKTTTFVMPAAEVEVEACYSASGSNQNNNGNSNGNDNGSNNSGTNNSGNNNSGNTNGNTNTGGNNSGGSNIVPVVITPVSQEVINNNSKVLDITAKVKWSKGAWKVSWSSISGAAGYDIYVKEGKGTPTGYYVNVTGAGSTTAYIKTINGKAIDRTKTYSFLVKAYRVVNQSKDYIGNSRVLYAAGDKNKTYTNVKKLVPAKKTVSVKAGKTKKLQTKYKKQKSSKKLVSNGSGKKFNYYSSDTSVATVSSSGKVRGIKKGTCYIYVVAHNGVNTRVKVKVK